VTSRVGRISPAYCTAAILLVFTAIGCRESSPPGPPEGGLSQITVSYVCGNDFELQNQGPLTLTVEYAVIGTSESGELVLPSGIVGTGTTTRLTTTRQGPLQISYGEEDLPPVDNSALSCPPPASALEPQATRGEWSPPFPWPVVAVHLHLLPTGRVLSWGRLGSPQVWDPATGQFTETPSSSMVFCSGHTYLPDGRLLVTGGHLDDQRGLPDANIFSAMPPGWTRIESMSRGRWYPTSTTLPTGDVLTLGGTDEDGAQVPVPEVWTGSAWHSLTGASRILPYYPRTFVAPNGLVFYAGELQQTAYLDPAGAGKWTAVAASNYGRRDYGSAVMYQPGKVLILGGSDPPNGSPTATAELIDLNQPAPTWHYTGGMAYARRQFNATLLPDGEVLVTGGTSSSGFSDPAGAVHAAEVWNPETGTWSLLAANQVTRVYHSTTLLLPDGRVLHTGSGDGPGLPRELNAEIFSPPYLFRGPRPVIADAPGTTGYGEQFFLATPDAGRVARVTLLRLASVTHAFDQSQRFLELVFRKSAGGLAVTAPSSSAVAPPGPYLMFILTGAGVPSAGIMVRVG
jgi:galactose oxidase